MDYEYFCRTIRKLFMRGKIISSRREHNNKVLFNVIAIIVVSIWGITFISTKSLLLSGLAPEEIFFIRFLIAYIGICFISSKKLFCDSISDEIRIFLTGITGGSLYFYTENTALEFTHTSNVSFIVCTTPLLTVLLLLIINPFFKSSERVVIKNLSLFLFGTFLALSGMFLLIFNGHFILKLSPKGDLIALLAAISWAFYSILIKSLLNKYGSAFVTRKVFFYGLITILPILVTRGDTFLHTDIIFTLKPLLNLLFLGVIASLICFVLWNKVINVIGTVSSSNYIYLNPIFTMIGASFFLHEKMTWVSAIGSGLILLGVFLSSKYISHDISNKTPQS